MAIDGDPGREIVLEWGGNEILGVREKGLAMNAAPLDTTSDENNGYRKLLAESGQDQIDISLSGVTKDGDLRADWFARDRLKSVVITWPNGDRLEGDFFLSTYSDTGPYNEATTFEATLMSAGEWTYTPYS